jgi:hypothetical protein
MATLSTVTITAENTFSTGALTEGYFNVSISGTFVATVFLQRSTDNTTWMDVDSFTTPLEQYGFDPEFMYYRIGVKTGGFTSGTIVCRIGGEDKEEH